MPKELYLYSPIYSFVAEMLISQMEESKNDDIVLRVNSAGGQVMPAWGIAIKMKEMKGKVTIKVDGAALSMAADLLSFGDWVICSDVSRFLIHRGDGTVNNQSEQDLLDKLNADLRAKFEKKVKPEKFKEVTGYTLDEIFDPNKRIDVWLDAKQAKAIGLVDEIVVLEASESSKFNGILFSAAAKSEAESKSNQNSNQKKKMTLDEFKAAHPELFTQVEALGITKGVAQERDRTGAWLALADADPDGVKKSIKDGEVLSQTKMVELTIKLSSGVKLKELGDGSAENIDTKEVKEKKDEKLETVEKFLADSKKLVTF